MPRLEVFAFPGVERFPGSSLFTEVVFLNITAENEFTVRINEKL